MAAYTTTSLLSAISRRGFVPTGQSTFSTTEILEVADEVMSTYIVPSIMLAREEYFVYYKDLSVVSDQANYKIPARGIGLTLREVQLINSSGAIKDLARTDIDRITTTTSQGTVEAFYLRNNELILYPTPNSADQTLRMYYFLEPGSFVTPSSAAVVSAIDTTTNVVTVSTIPSTWATGNTFDFVRGDGAHEYRGTDYISTDITGTNITFSSLPSDLAVGDYLALQGYSPLVQLPRIYRPVLATLTAAELVTAQNQPGGEAIMNKGLGMLNAAQKLITQRVQGEDEIIVPDWY